MDVSLRQVRRLEKTLGVKLFDRAARSRRKPQSDLGDTASAVGLDGAGLTIRQRLFAPPVGVIAPCV